MEMYARRSHASTTFAAPTQVKYWTQMFPATSHASLLHLHQSPSDIHEPQDN